nr:energy transducer TonB [uncultured Undibacterium sp.]
MRFDSTIEEPDIITDTAVANRRLFGGILVSLLVHALILSLQFGIPGLDLPSLEAPWKEKRTAMDALQIDIASPAPKAQAVPPTAAVTKPELFKLPTPILPAPVPKTGAPATSGIQIIAPLAQAKTLVPTAKLQKSKPKSALPIPPSIKRVPPPAQAPTRIIAQDLQKNDDFVVPLTSEEDLLRNAQDKKEVKQKMEAISEDAIIDKNAEADLLVEEKRQEEIKQKKLEQERLDQEKLRAEQKQQDELLQKKIAQAAEEKLKSQIEQQMQQQTTELKRQQADQIAQQRLQAQQKAAQELAQREQMAKEAAEEALREAKRQELFTQETLKQEEQRRQAEQKRLRQLALEQEQQKQEALAQAQLRQKQLEEQVAQKRALEIAERQRQQVEEQRIEAQRLAQIAEQKLAEQKILEQKIQEQRLAEQRAAEQKALEQKLAEQKQAEQKQAEQKQAERKIAEQGLAEQKTLADAAARANAEREAALAARQNASGNNRDGLGQGRGGTGVDNAGRSTASGTGQGDLASRLREQARNTDLFKSAPSNGKLLDENRSRRRSFLGTYDKEVPLRMYVDSLKQKLERNGNLIHERRTLSDVEHNVLVNMVVRSDGSIEEVVIMRSSGSRAIDEKARNIIMTNAPFSVFPPGLAAKYDVIEIQRVWSFGDKLRILENLPSSF